MELKTITTHEPIELKKLLNQTKSTVYQDAIDSWVSSEVTRVVDLVKKGCSSVSCPIVYTDIPRFDKQGQPWNNRGSDYSFAMFARDLVKQLQSIFIDAKVEYCSTGSAKYIDVSVE